MISYFQKIFELFIPLVFIIGFRMEHVSGSVGCIGGDSSYWGCKNHVAKEVIMTIITGKCTR